MRKIITSNSQIEFQEVNSTGTLLNSIGLQLGEVYFIIKGNKVSFYLNDSEKPFDSFIWSIDIPFYLDDTLIDNPNDASAALGAIMNDSFQEQLDALQEELATEEGRAQAAEEALDGKIDDEIARAVSAETNLQSEITSVSATVATFDGRITNVENGLSALTETVNDEITRSTAKDSEHDALISGLNTSLQNEIIRAQGAESALTNSLNNEIARATSAETVLHNEILAERDRAHAAENAIDDKVDAEVSRSTAKDASQDALISGLTTSLQTEINRAQGAENSLRSDLNDEVSARTSADSAMAQRITALEVGKADKSDLNNYYTKAESDAKYPTKDYISGLTSSFFDDAVYDKNTKRINFYNGNAILTYIDATDFIKDGMVDNVKIENNNLVITFNTDSGKEPISIPLTDIFNPNNYYTKTEINASQTAQDNKINAISGDVQTLSGESVTSGEVQTMINKAVSGKADSNSVYSKTESDNKYQLKGDYVTNAQMSAYTYDKQTIDDKIAEGGTFDPTQYYTKTATDTLLADKASTTALTQVNNAVTAHTANTSIHVTAAEKNTWNAKSDFSGNYNDLTNKPTIPSLDGYATEAYVSGYTYDKQTIDDKIAQGGTFDPTQYYNKTQTNALLDLKADTANTYTKSEVNGLVADKADTTALTQVNNAVTAHTANTTVHVTAAEKSSWNNKSDFSGNYNDLTNKPTIPNYTAGSGITISNNVISAKIWQGTKVQYDAITTKDADTIYLIYNS